MSDAQQTKEESAIDLGKQIDDVGRTALALIDKLRAERDEWKAKCTEAQRLTVRQANEIRRLRS